MNVHLHTETYHDYECVLYIESMMLLDFSEEHQRGAQPSDVNDFRKRHQRGAQPSDVSRRNQVDWPVYI